MAHQSPIRHRIEHDDTDTLFFGDPEQPDLGALVTETFGPVESEYAAIRKGAALIDAPHRATLAAAGPDHLDFLNNMLTQELKPQGNPRPHYTNTNAFWLNRKGRIDADLRLTFLPHTEGLPGPAASTDPPATLTLFDLDILAAPHTTKSLSDFIITEDATLTNTTPATHRLQLHGPAAARLIADLATPHPDHPEAPNPAELRNNQSTVVTIANHPAVIDRDDHTAEIGLHILTHLEHAKDVFDAIAKHARDDFGHHNDPATDTYKLRHAGWAAYNIARIEAGTPLFRVDFSTNNLPAETSLLEQRVSFTKGCYLGQEVVARMHALGKPKQILAPIKLTNPEDANNDDALPHVTANVFLSNEDANTNTPDAKPIGAVTSSAHAPMLGGAPVALAQIKTQHAAPNTKLLVDSTGAGLRPATVHNTPAFFSRS